MRRLLGPLVGGLLLAASAHAQGVTASGFGRVTLGVGWRLTPNDFFYARAREAGHEKAAASPGGPAVCLAFGYSATENLEVAIDLHGSGESLRLTGVSALTSITYGALAGVRLQFPGLLSELLVPYLGLFTGPTLVYVSSEDFPPEERFSAAWAGAAGATLRLGERFGATLEYKLLLVRGMVPEIGSINGGGHQLTLGFTLYFPPEPLPGESPR